MKSKIQASFAKQFEYTKGHREGKMQVKQQPISEKYYQDYPWLWKPTEEEKKKGKRIRIVCKNCGFEVAEMTILDKKTYRTRWWDWEIRACMKDGKWYGILDHNINKPVEKGGRKYLPAGYMTVSCCCGNSERDQLKMPVDSSKKVHKGFKIRYK